MRRARADRQNVYQGGGGVQAGGGQPQYAYQNSRDLQKPGRYQLFLGRVLRDDSDPTYAKRIGASMQFCSLIASAVGTPQASPLVSDQMMRMFGSLFENGLGDPRAPVAYKQSLAKSLSAIGSTYLDDPAPFLKWVFERLEGSHASTQKEKE
ncbi:hypothetical protein BDK51DRAFT_32809, partial [Blyttiomyces helicus]